MEMNSVRVLQGCPGFTLVELMVTVVVAAILAVVAVPSFTSFTLNQRVKATSFELVSVLTYVRSEAIKRNDEITLTANDGDWLQGWTVLAGDSELWSGGPRGRISITTSDETEVTFRPDGRADRGMQFIVCDQNGSAAVIQRIIRLDTSGRPSITRGVSCDN
jgi:type IV fimbrial biogenesis protein FimT